MFRPYASFDGCRFSASHFSTASTDHAVTRSESLTGAGNFPWWVQSQIVLLLTGMRLVNSRSLMKPHSKCDELVVSK